MSVSLVIAILLILLLVGCLPTWGYSRNYGWAPSGGIGFILLILLILFLFGVI